VDSNLHVDHVSKGVAEF